MRLVRTVSGSVAEAGARAFRMPRIRLLALAFGLALLCACKSLLPKLEAPQLTVIAIHLGPTGNMQQQQARLTLHAVNPNDRAIPIRSIDCTLELESTPFAEGKTAAAFVLPAAAWAMARSDTASTVRCICRVHCCIRFPLTRKAASSFSAR